MPELIQDGPDIPVELMNRRDDGNVIFFCGSGISASTGLPMFDGLVSKIYERTAQPPTEREQKLMDKGQPDKVLGLLEDRLNPGSLRREAIGILTAPPPKNSLDTHKALLSLSHSTDHGIRLVTTNFDDRFKRAADADQRPIAIDEAPKLPLPKPHGWGSLVHLHGRITDDADGQNLVLTAADFGRAYLTERWASRFITELFREFTIVFVGYSLNDPVMSYMVDALAAERGRGARFQKAYAFADFKDGDEERRQSELTWQAKNVTPILFDAQDDFGKLTRTLVKWADISRDPIKSRRRIVFDELRNLPANAKDPIAQRVIWALSDKPTTEALAEAPAITDKDKFPILAGWLDVFDEAGLLSRPGEILAGDSARQTPIVGNAHTQHANNPLDDISKHFASWLAKHLHVPQVLGWAARKGGHLHPYFRFLVRHRLFRNGDDESEPHQIPERLRLLWTILVQNTLVDRDEDSWWKGLIENAASDIERALVERALIASVRPHLTVLPGPSTRVSPRNPGDGNPAPPPTPLEECAHLKLSAGENWNGKRLDQVPFKEDLLANHAFTITEYLRHIDRLLPLNEAGLTIPWFYRPAIEEHEQNRNGDDWTFLIGWARDGYFALIKRNAPRADILVRMWVESDIPLLHRLALHVLTEDADADIHMAIRLLLAGDPACVWSKELYHEVMVFLRKAGGRLPPEGLGQLIETIKAGPPSSSKDEDNKQRRERDINIRLSKLVSSGAKLDVETRRIADTYQPPQDEIADSDEFLSWSGKTRWVRPREHVRPEWQKGPPINELINQIRENQLDEEEFDGICRTWPSRALATLRKLADAGHWPAAYWRCLLWSTDILRREGKPRFKMRGCLASLLLRAPDDLYTGAVSAISPYIEHLSKECPINDENTFRELWNRTWGAAVDEPDVGTDDVLTQALNSAAGQLAKAAFNRLWKYQPEAGKGLPEPVFGYFESIVASDVGRLGRVRLATKLSSLFAIAPNWTSRSLLPCMRWNTSKEARDLWNAYAWESRAGPNLLAAIKDDFISALGKYSELGEQPSNLVHLFMAASIDANSIITPKEIRGVIDKLPEDGLIAVADFFENRLGEKEEQQADTWKNICLPWLQDYWPKARGQNTANTSIKLVRCLIKTGDAFPDALKWAKEFLQPGIDHDVLWGIRESGVHQRWAADTLKMLALMIPDNNFENWNRDMLRNILDQMRETDQTIARNNQYQRLYRL